MATVCSGFVTAAWSRLALSFVGVQGNRRRWLAVQEWPCGPGALGSHPHVFTLIESSLHVIRKQNTHHTYTLTRHAQTRATPHQSGRAPGAGRQVTQRSGQIDRCERPHRCKRPCQSGTRALDTSANARRCRQKSDASCQVRDLSL